jgi:hypothetical protein
MMRMVQLNKGSAPQGAHSEEKENGNAEQPTAFILKLFEMINDAPDEVIAVSSEDHWIGYLAQHAKCVLA